MVIWMVVNRITKIIFDHLNDKFLNQIIFNYETSYIAEKFFLKPTSFFLKHLFVCEMKKLWTFKTMRFKTGQFSDFHLKVLRKIIILK